MQYQFTINTHFKISPFTLKLTCHMTFGQKSVDPHWLEFMKEEANASFFADRIPWKFSGDKLFSSAKGATLIV